MTEPNYAEQRARQTQKRQEKKSRYAGARTGTVEANVRFPDEAGEHLVATVNAVLAAGDAIMFARTTGGGIVAVTVYSQGCEPEKFYARDVEELYFIMDHIERAAKA